MKVIKKEAGSIEAAICEMAELYGGLLPVPRPFPESHYQRQLIADMKARLRATAAAILAQGGSAGARVGADAAAPGASASGVEGSVAAAPPDPARLGRSSAARAVAAAPMNRQLAKSAAKTKKGKKAEDSDEEEYKEPVMVKSAKKENKPSTKKKATRQKK